jgi:hypothetical protein
MKFSLPKYEQEILKRQEKDFKRWEKASRRIVRALLSYLPGLDQRTKNNKPKNFAASEIIHAQINTFLSLVVLYDYSLFIDARVLLRTLYEGGLHLWNICKGSEDQAKRYLALHQINNWQIMNELLEIEGAKYPNLNDEEIEKTRKEYMEAMKFFNAGEGKIPGNYTTTSNKNLAKQIAEEEGNYWLIMHTRLYSAGSQFVHRTSKGIKKGYFVYDEDDKEIKWTRMPNIDEGIEILWWATVVIFHSTKVFAEFNGEELPKHILETQEKVNNLLTLQYGIEEMENEEKEKLETWLSNEDYYQ